MTSNLFDVVVVGCGLSGLSVASKLLERNLSVAILEARNVPGGRIRSVRDAKTAEWLGDLGPSWVWPDYQPVTKKWLKQLNLATNPQYSSGNSVIELNPETQPLAREIPCQAGVERITGGSSMLTERLTERTLGANTMFGKKVKSLMLLDESIYVSCADQSEPLRASRVVVALPPRIAQRITYSPKLPESITTALNDTPTWMAPHAKVVLLFEYPFWRHRGLNGHVTSQVGPMVELQDQCGEDGFPAALTGFIGMDYIAREKTGDRLESMIKDQLKRLFGSDVPQPTSIVVKDWASDEFVATSDDLAGVVQHPTVGPDSLRKPYFENKLWFAGSETSAISPGLIEGAFAAADEISQQIFTTL